MSCGRKEWDSSQLRKYDLNLEPIHRLHYKDPKVDELMKSNVREIICLSEILFKTMSP